ncbi:MAG: 2OG-Fe(II) oxygenase [Allosphingosinicella sp.]
MNAPLLLLDPGIDPDRLAHAYRAQGWVQIAPFLDAAGAERLRADIESRSEWTLALRAGVDRILAFDPEVRAAMSAAQRQALDKLAAPGEGKALHYLYERIDLIGAAGVMAEAEAATSLGAFARFLSSEAVLGLVRAVTGAAGIGFAQAQATRYAPGHFLTVHNDREDEGGRFAAYVFNLTLVWRPEWGGMLLFHDEAGDVEHGLAPRMNALNLFAVPKRHSVGLVAPFAPRPRHAVTGWFRRAPAS